MHSKKKNKKTKPKVVAFKDSNYELEYKIFNCEIKKMHPAIEIKRFQIMNEIKNKFYQLLIQNIDNENLRDNTKNLKQLSNEFLIRFFLIIKFYKRPCQFSRFFTRF